MVPFKPVDKFIGRKDIMADIEEKLETTRRVTLAGIGGVG
jgi:hypothetical protein